MQDSPDLSIMRLDSTIVRAHVSAAGASRTKAVSALKFTSWWIDGVVPCAYA